jgi:hypothetical protein
MSHVLIDSLPFGRDVVRLIIERLLASLHGYNETAEAGQPLGTGCSRTSWQMCNNVGSPVGGRGHMQSQGWAPSRHSGEGSEVPRDIL